MLLVVQPPRLNWTTHVPDTRVYNWYSGTYVLHDLETFNPRSAPQLLPHTPIVGLDGPMHLQLWVVRICTEPARCVRWCVYLMLQFPCVDTATHAFNDTCDMTSDCSIWVIAWVWYVLSGLVGGRVSVCVCEVSTTLSNIMPQLRPVRSLPVTFNLHIRSDHNRYLRPITHVHNTCVRDARAFVDNITSSYVNY